MFINLKSPSYLFCGDETSWRLGLLVISSTQLSYLRFYSRNSNNLTPTSYNDLSPPVHLNDCTQGIQSVYIGRYVSVRISLSPEGNTTDGDYLNVTFSRFLLNTENRVTPLQTTVSFLNFSPSPIYTGSNTRVWVVNLMLRRRGKLSLPNFLLVLRMCLSQVCICTLYSILIINGLS